MGKPSLFLGLRAAQKAACRLIEDYGIAKPAEIELEDIAFDLGLRVVEGRLSGAAASLVVAGRSGVIRVSPYEPYPYRKRFSIAHEVGHFVLKHGHSLQKLCSEQDMVAWYDASEETQANAFATELILPKRLVARRCDVAEVTFDPVRKISEDFRASLTATAIRFVRLCPEICAVALSRENKIAWVVGSEDWSPFIRRGTPLGEHSLAARFFRGEDLPEEADEVWGNEWIAERAPKCLVEHSVGSRRLGFVLSLLWVEISG